MEITKEELLDMIPDELYELKVFLKKGEHHYEIYDRFLMIDEVDFLGRQYMIEIDMDNEAVRFIDDLVDVESVASNYNENINRGEWESLRNQLERDIAKTGFLFRGCQNGGNDDYIWHELVISVFDFTQENLSRATQLWSNYNDERRSSYVI